MPNCNFDTNMKWWFFFDVYSARTAFSLALMLLGVQPLSMRLVAQLGYLAPAAALVFSMLPLWGWVSCAPCGGRRPFLA